MADIMYVVAACIQNDKGETLIAKRPQGKPWAGYWEFPGGKIDPGETPEQAIIREVEEETALEISAENLLPLTFVSKGYDNHPHVVMFVYVVRNYSGAAAPQEGQEHAWVPQNQLMDYKAKSLDADTHLFDSLLALMEHEHR